MYQQLMPWWFWVVYAFGTTISLWFIFSPVHAYGFGIRWLGAIVPPAFALRIIGGIWLALTTFVMAFNAISAGFGQR